MMRGSQRGFSLLELMIVIAIIVTLSAMTIPSYLRARQRAYEASAVGFAHSVQTDQVAYKATHGSYATSFNQLPGYSAAAADQSGNTGSIDAETIQQAASNVLGAPVRAGGATSSVIRNSYVFTLTTLDDDQWYISAFPLLDRVNGLYIYADETGRLQSKKGGPPTQADTLHAQ
jgi:prepilin-type N-terminal cleavage/methylation domain-containing protein